MPDAVREYLFFFFSSRRRHTRLTCDWSSDVWSSDLVVQLVADLDQPRKQGHEGIAPAAGAQLVPLAEELLHAKVKPRAELVVLDHALHEVQKIGRASCRERG